MDKQQPGQNLSSSSSSVLQTSTSPVEEQSTSSSSSLPPALLDESLLLSNVLDQEFGNNSISLETIWNDLIQSAAIVDLEQQQCQQDDMMNLNPSSFDQFASLGNDYVNMVLDSLDNNNNISNIATSCPSSTYGTNFSTSSSLPSTSQSNSFLLSSSSLQLNTSSTSSNNNNDNLVTSSTSSSSPHFGYSSILSPSSSVSQTSSSKFNTTNYSSSEEEDDNDDDYVEPQQQKRASSQRVNRKRKRVSKKREVGIKKSRGKLIYEQMMSPEPKKSKSTKKKYKKCTKTESKKKKDNNKSITYSSSMRIKLTKPDSQRVKSKNFQSSISHLHPNSFLKINSVQKNYIQCELEHKNQTVFQHIVKYKDGRFNIMERKRNPELMQPGAHLKQINEFIFDENEAEQLRKEEEEVKRLSQLLPQYTTRLPESIKRTTSANNHNTFSFHDDDNNNAMSSRSSNNSNQNSNRNQTSCNIMTNTNKKIVLVDYQISDEDMEEEMTEQTLITTTIEQQKINEKHQRDEIVIISSETSSTDGEKSPINNNSNQHSVKTITLNSPSSGEDSDLQFVVHFPAPAIVNVKQIDQDSSSSNHSDGFDMKNIRIDTCITTTATTSTTASDTHGCPFNDKVALKRELNIIPNEVLTNTLNNSPNESTKHSDDDDDIRILSPVPPEEKEIEVINLSSDSENEGGGESSSQSTQDIIEQQQDNDVTFIRCFRRIVKSEIGKNTIMRRK